MSGRHRSAKVAELSTRAMSYCRDNENQTFSVNFVLNIERLTLLDVSTANLSVHLVIILRSSAHTAVLHRSTDYPLINKPN